MIFSSIRIHRRARSLLAATLVASALPTVSTVAMADPASEAKASLKDADKAASAKDWATAARSFDAANKTEPSSRALEGLANALYQAGRLVEAHASYKEWLDLYGAKTQAPKRKLAETRLNELAGKTGELTITVREPGARVFVDDAPVGVAPLTAPVRLKAGPHRLRVTKDTFLPFESEPNIPAGGVSTAEVSLTAESTQGTLVVKEQSGKPLRVTVDGVDVGDAPWTGAVEAGTHEVGGRGAALVAKPESVEVLRGTTKEVVLAAETQSGAVKIATSDGRGLIFLDGKVVNEGTFFGELPPGRYALKITREGYDPFEEVLVVNNKESLARSITLKLSPVITTGQVVETERANGLYGGFHFIGLLTPAGTGSSMQKTCEAKDATPTLASCDAQGGIGGGLGGHIGYAWDPVGLELYLAAHYDQRSIKLDWNESDTNPGVGADPARIEDFSLLRAGGLSMARIRLSAQWKRVRLSFAAGAGVSYRVMILGRETTSKTGIEPGDIYLTRDPQTYLSPVVGFEPSVMIRLSRSVALALGAQVLLETPSSFLNNHETPRTTPESIHGLGLGLNRRYLSTPSYELASGMQLYVGPVLGLAFGP